MSPKITQGGQKYVIKHNNGHNMKSVSPLKMGYQTYFSHKYCYTAICAGKTDSVCFSAYSGLDINDSLLAWGK